MQERHLFEYAVIRAVPRVEREEFLNVGVVLYCAGKRFLQVRYDTGLQRLAVLAGRQEVEEVACYLHSFAQICAGGKDGGTIGRLPVAERFRWLTATRSTVVQASKVHPGFCTDPAEKLNELYMQLVAPVSQAQ
ncbi:DUF3037 domain-containing protein [Nemorincola caseinilytica]|uniref:DUF3037 domain-containing protein n=1 Tax=Nemorincola caseinilytica TaxID=2054315 RepID=A0ABP8NPA8_9BACT